MNSRRVKGLLIVIGIAEAMTVEVAEVIAMVKWLRKVTLETTAMKEVMM